MRIDQIQWTQPPIPVPAQQLEAVEAAVGIRYPDDLRQFLQRFQGLYPDNMCLRLVIGGRRDCVSVGQFVGVFPECEAFLPKIMSYFDKRLPAGLQPFAVEAGGNLFCIDSANNAGEVIYWDSELEGMVGESTPVARTFSEFLDKLEPYDERTINAWIASAS